MKIEHRSSVNSSRARRLSVSAGSIALSVFALCYVAGISGTGVPVAHAEELTVEGCMKHEPHEHVTFFLVDRTDDRSDTQNLKTSMESLKESIRPGERLIVGIFGARGNDAKVVMDVVRPEKSLWESALKIRAKEKAFGECFQKMETALLQHVEPTKTSAILETISFVSNTLASDQSKSKRILMFSDMIQNSTSLSFYSVKTVDPEGAMKGVEKSSLVSPLKDVELYVAGSGGNLTDEKARQVEQFWRKYFEKSGAALKSYGPVFLGAQG